MQDRDEYYKERRVLSEFPQTMLKGSQDYASSGIDAEHEILREGDALDKIDQFVRDYKDVDVQILDELEELFSDIITVNINGF